MRVHCDILCNYYVKRKIFLGILTHRLVFLSLKCKSFNVRSRNLQYVTKYMIRNQNQTYITRINKNIRTCNVFFQWNVSLPRNYNLQNCNLFSSAEHLSLESNETNYTFHAKDIYKNTEVSQIDEQQIKSDLYLPLRIQWAINKRKILLKKKVLVKSLSIDRNEGRKSRYCLREIRS